MQPQVRQVLEKLESLSTEKLAEVESFIDFLHYKDNNKHLKYDFTQAAESSFNEIWDNSEDEDYDKL